jgi:hypothetical protein
VAARVGWSTIKRLLAALAIVAMLGGGVSLASILIFSDYGKPAPIAQQSTPRRTLAAPPPSVPTPKEFMINVVVTSQDCPPDGGCVYKYTIEPKYIGFHPLPQTPFTVEYEVVGGNEPQPGQFTVSGNQAQILKDVVLEGPPGAQLLANVTSVTG